MPRADDKRDVCELLISMAARALCLDGDVKKKFQNAKARAFVAVMTNH